jgi:CBS domain-containing protein
MNVAGVLKQKGSEVISVAPATTVREIAALITSRRIGAVVVIDGEQTLAGIVSERDLVKALASAGEAALAMTAADIMTRELTVASPKTTIDEAMGLMDAGYFRHLPVVDNGAMVGIISVRDVVRAHIQHQEYEVDTLKSFVLRGAPADGLR